MRVSGRGGELKEERSWNRHAEEERLKLSNVKNHNPPFVLNKDWLFGSILIELLHTFFLRLIYLVFFWFWLCDWTAECYLRSILPNKRCNGRSVISICCQNSIHLRVFKMYLAVLHVGAPSVYLCENENPCNSLDAALVISLCFLSRGSLRAFCLENTSECPICSKCLHVLLLVLVSGPLLSILFWQKMRSQMLENVREHLFYCLLTFWFIYFHYGWSIGSSGMPESVALSML